MIKKLKEKLKTISREIKEECIYCGVKLKIWNWKKSYCPKCGKDFD